MNISPRFAAGAALAVSAALVVSVAAADPKLPPRSPNPHFNFIRIPVADLDRSTAFYTTVIGLHERGRLTPKGSVEVFFGFDDDPMTIAVNLTHREGATAAAPTPAGPNTLAFVLPDVVAAVAHVSASTGGKVVQPARHIEVQGAGLTVAFVDDPEGNHLELLHYEKIDAASK
jgi:predicted enzyme related to lactoylglutathione lyase